MRLKNRLWNPEHEQPKTVKDKRKPPQDEICLLCPNYKDDYCKGLCPPLQWINGRAETKELIPDHPIEITNPNLTDYNSAIHELIKDKETRDIERLELIRNIENYKLKGIAACILVEMTQEQTGKFAHISQTRISRLFRGVK